MKYKCVNVEATVFVAEGEIFVAGEWRPFWFEKDCRWGEVHYTIGDDDVELPGFDWEAFTHEMDTYIDKLSGHAG